MKKKAPSSRRLRVRTIPTRKPQASRRPLPHARSTSTATAWKRQPQATEARGADTCQIAGHFPLVLRSRLKHLEATTGRTLQALLGEAIDDVLLKYAKEKRSSR